MTNLPSAACAPHISRQGRSGAQAAKEPGLPADGDKPGWPEGKKRGRFLAHGPFPSPHLDSYHYPGSWWRFKMACPANRVSPSLSRSPRRCFLRLSEQGYVSPHHPALDHDSLGVFRPWIERRVNKGVGAFSCFESLGTHRHIHTCVTSWPLQASCMHKGTPPPMHT